MTEKIVICGTCGTMFDLLKAKPCKHNKDGVGTMECPNGHCICNFPVKAFRWASPSEQKLGFAFVLKEAWKKEEKATE